MAETGDLKSLQCGFESRHRHCFLFREIMKLPSPSFLFLCVLLLGAFSARAWDYTGHMLVDQIAYEQVSPKVREAVARIVAPLENSYNEHKPYNFITAGAWLDDIRSQPHYPYRKLHYVDVPFTPSGSAFTVPPPPHVLSGIEDALATLRAPESPDAQKTTALAMLMHFAGDVHEPLHCVDWNDYGGNQYLISGVPFTDLPKKYSPNLHAFWDEAYRFDKEGDAIVERYPGVEIAARTDAPESGLLHDEAVKIIAQSPRASLPQLAQKSPVEWARESHRIACLFCYPVRPHPAKGEIVPLTPEYARRAHDIAREQIALAGYRLADWLEELFGK